MGVKKQKKYMCANEAYHVFQALSKAVTRQMLPLHQAAIYGQCLEKLANTSIIHLAKMQNQGTADLPFLLLSNTPRVQFLADWQGLAPKCYTDMFHFSICPQ